MMMTIGIGLCRPFISFYFVTKIITSWLLTMTIINGCPVNNYVPKWSKFDNYALEWWKFGFFFFVLFWKVVALQTLCNELSCCGGYSSFLKDYIDFFPQDNIMYIYVSFTKSYSLHFHDLNIFLPFYFSFQALEWYVAWIGKRFQYKN